MRKNLLLLATLTGFALSLQAQKRPETEPAPPTPRVAKPADNNNAIRLALDSSVTTSNAVTIKGQRVPYTATAGTIPVWDEMENRSPGCFIPIMKDQI